MAAALLLGICFASIGCVGEGLSSILTDRSIPPDPNDRDGQGSNQPPDAPPFNFSATLGDALVLLAWTPKDGLNYDAYFSEMTGVTTETGTKLENITSPYTHRDLTNGTTYYYILVARNDAGVGPPTGEQSATPMANAAPPAPPVLPCSTIDGKLTVCVEVSRRMITEIQSDQPVTEVTLRTSDPIEGDRDSINVFMQGVDVPMMAGMGTLPGTATLDEDYTVVVTEPAGYAFPLYDDGFDEYTLSLSKLRPMITFEIRANDDDAAPPMMGTNPRNENTDENITIEITGVVGSTRSGDTKVQNAILDPDLTGGTITLTAGRYFSLQPLDEMNVVGSQATTAAIELSSSLVVPSGSAVFDFDSNNNLYFGTGAGIQFHIYQLRGLSGLRFVSMANGSGGGFFDAYISLEGTINSRSMSIDRRTTPNIIYMIGTLMFNIDLGRVTTPRWRNLRNVVIAPAFNSTVSGGYRHASSTGAPASSLPCALSLGTMREVSNTTPAEGISIAVRPFDAPGVTSPLSIF